MGDEKACSATIDGRRYRGTARLESSSLTFRGETRLTIPLTEIGEARANEGSLFVTAADCRAVFELGDDAEKWARRISHPPSRMEKLGVKRGMRTALVNLEDDSLTQDIESRGAAVVGGSATGLDVLFFGARTATDLSRLRALASRLKPEGAIWLIRAKGKAATVTESESMAAAKRAGLVDVKVVSFSETHTAEKYVIPVAKRGRSARSSVLRSRRSGSTSSPDRT